MPSRLPPFPRPRADVYIGQETPLVPARAAAALAAILTLAASALADETWVQTRSAHFTVVSNAGQKAAETVALQFERVRAMFKRQWPWARVDAAEPTVIFAVRDEKTMRSLLPAFWQRKDGTRPEGMSLAHPDRITLFVRTDLADDQNPFAVHYHEYTHRLLALNFASLPLWLNEGLAEFFGSSLIDGDDLSQGKPRPETIMLLRSSALLPLATLFEVDQTSPHYNEQTRATIFYAQSWALVHYLILGDKQAHATQLDDLVSRIRRGEPESEARAALGDPKALERALASYVRNFVFTYRRARDYVGESDRGLSTLTLSGAQAAALRGDVLARTGHVAEARALLDEAIKLDASLPEPYETLAALSLGQQRPDEARANAQKAIVRMTTNYFTWFLAGVLATKGEKLTEEAEKALRQSLELNPDYAPAVATLADLLAAVEKHQDESARLALRVSGLAPTNPLLQLAAAGTLAKLDRTDEARAIALRIQSQTPSGPVREAATKMLSSALPKDPMKRLAFHLKGCEEGKAVDCREAGDLYSGGEGVARDDPRAVELYRKACDAHDSRSCAWLGERYADGRGVVQDEARAAELYEGACKEFPWACAQLGLLYFEGHGVAKDAARSETLLAQACDGSEDWACARLAWMLAGGHGVPEDLPRAARLYEKACQGEWAGGCSGLARMYAEGKGMAKDDGRAAELYRKACEMEPGDSCAAAGYRYENGLGVAANATLAASLYQRGCDGNYAESCVYLGAEYAAGRGVSMDLSRAVELFSKACTAGDGLGCEYAGAAYAEGKGVAADRDRAAEFLEAACTAKKRASCLGLGHALLDGKHPAPARAIARLKASCDGGTGVSCALLAAAFGKGVGVASDPVKAGTLLKRACDLGFEQACPSHAVAPTDAKQVVDAVGGDCASGAAAACAAAGTALLANDEFVAAAGFFGRGCDGGDAASCAQLATAHLLGRGVARDPAKARALYKKACEAGDKSACQALRLTK